MSAAVERATHQLFLRFMQEQVFDPLGMRDTRADSTTKPIPDRATFYFPRYSADPKYGPDPMREIVPERGIVVAVTSNISYADTFSLASRIAEASAPNP